MHIYIKVMKGKARRKYSLHEKTVWFKYYVTLV